jgi:Ca-activated chloride channel family protein
MKLKSFPSAFLPMVMVLFLVEAAFTQAISSPAASSRATGRADSLVINTQLVSVTISVTDKEGRHFTGLDPSAFTIFEDDVAQKISFFGADDGPASIGIVFDHSGSMKGEKSTRAREAIARFVQTGHQDDEYSLLAFNDQTQTLLDHVRDGEYLTRVVDNITPKGNTALFDAVAAALEKVKQGRWEKRALIIISDGEDNRSRITMRKLRQTIMEAGVTVYAVIIDPSRLPRAFGAEDLKTLAAHSGGSAFIPETASQMSEVFDQITLEMRQRYSVGYEPTDTNAAGAWRRLKVKVSPPPGTPKLLVKMRAGYYTTNSPSQVKP